ncbi:MAG: hypothetical protein HC774_01215 [Sphingomonadales bacterium]|nr:hypothetical protein [Sphingomonadales bacterium]
MFSPFLGYEAHVWPTSDVHELPDVLADTVHRRRQRRRYEDACIANAHVQLEVLPTLQPEAAMYVEELLDQQPIGLITTRSDGRVSTINRRASSHLMSQSSSSGQADRSSFPNVRAWAPPFLFSRRLAASVFFGTRDFRIAH